MKVLCVVSLFFILVCWCIFAFYCASRMGKRRLFRELSA